MPSGGDVHASTVIRVVVNVEHHEAEEKKIAELVLEVAIERELAMKNRRCLLKSIMITERDDAAVKT